MTWNKIINVEIESKDAPRSPDSRNVSYALVEIFYKQDNSYNYKDSLLILGEIKLNRIRWSKL